MSTIKGPEDIKRSVHLKVLQKTSSSVYRSRLPPRSAGNTHHAHHLTSMRKLPRRMKHEWENRLADVLQVVEEHRYGRANALYSALDETTRLLNDVNRRKAEIETFAEELEAANEEMQASNDELQAITEDLERANTDLEQFALVASHDLKEPLQTIRKHAEGLVEEYRDTLAEHALNNVDYIIGETRHMADLVDSVLTYARINIDTEAFKPVDSGEALQQTLRTIEAGIVESGAIITQDPLPVIDADPLQFSRILLNALGNAVKYHKPGEANRIHVGAREEPDEWIFSVADSGIGVDAEYLEDVFKMFVRLHTLKEYPGAGMGLAIAERIVRRHKGRIWMESEGVGKGSTLFFSVHKGL